MQRRWGTCLERLAIHRADCSWGCQESPWTELQYTKKCTQTLSIIWKKSMYSKTCHLQSLLSALRPKFHAQMILYRKVPVLSNHLPNATYDRQILHAQHHSPGLYIAWLLETSTRKETLRPFYTSEVTLFRSGFNPDRTEFIPSTLKPVPVESISNRFESIHFAMWFRSRSNRMAM